MNQLFERLSASILLSEQDKILLNEVIEPVEVPANTELVSVGEKTESLYFINSGIVKGSIVENGEKTVEYLYEQDHFFSAIDSFMFQNPAEECFETITDCGLLKMDRSGFIKLKESDQKWLAFLEKIYQSYLTGKMEKARDFQDFNEKERYTRFIKQFPQLALHVSSEDIASYLRIDPELLVEIRKEISEEDSQLQMG